MHAASCPSPASKPLSGKDNPQNSVLLHAHPHVFLRSLKLTAAQILVYVEVAQLHALSSILPLHLMSVAYCAAFGLTLPSACANKPQVDSDSVQGCQAHHGACIPVLFPADSILVPLATPSIRCRACHWYLLSVLFP